MDVKSGYPWWPVRNGLLREYPALNSDRECEVAVIGAGITGALIADALTEASLDVLVLDKRDVAWGSTSASTALLQYEIDTELLELGKLVGESNAVQAYRACERALHELDVLACGMDAGYRNCESLYFASSRGDTKRLRGEFEARRRHSFDVQWLDDAAVQDRFGFSAPAALLSRPAARVDPYRLAHALLARRCARGLQVFDRTEVADMEFAAARVHLHTASGHRVSARRVVVAAGYETETFLPEKVARNRSSYALVSEPLDPFPSFLANLVAWETARPYLYWRDNGDGRLIVGGEDDAIDQALKRDLRVRGKSEKLLKRMRKLFPQIALDIGFAWAGTFAETVDGLPWFGRHPQCDPRVLFAMAYGGNGITYSVIGAGILKDTLLGRTHPLTELFGFARRRN